MLQSYSFARKLAYSIFKRHCIIVPKMSSEVSTELIKRKSENLSDEENASLKKVKTNEEEATDPLVENILKNSNRVRKPKKVVLLLSYLGKEFFGMQRNANVSTVEEVLFKALLETEIILKGEFDFPKSMKFQRAARTDKGVSAVRQIVSLKIPLKEICNSLPEKVNKYLPPEVRVVAVRRVTQSFDAKIACDARTYSYMLPTFAFSPTSENDEQYRITGERIDEVNKFLQNFIGTKNFYNFTSGRLPGDPSCKRYIIACECGPPFLSNGIEFSVIKVKGQSFMLHQIRKMVGLAIAFMRNLADENVLKKAWLNERIDIPKAPGLGLMLEELHYDWYNTKYGADGQHEALQWDEYDEIVNEFKREKICANIAKTEREEKSMMQWLETLPHHSYDVRDAGPPTMLPPKEVSELNENKTSGDSVLCTDDISADKVHENSSESCNSAFNEASKKGKQMMTNCSKSKAANQDGFFDATFQRAFEGEAYCDIIGLYRRYRLEKAKKDLPAVCFKYSSPTKKPSGKGSNYGTFADYDKKLEHFSSKAADREKYSPAKKNFYVNPPKKGTGYGYPDVTIGKLPPYFLDSEYEELKNTSKGETKRPQMRPFQPYRAGIFQQEYFDPNPYKRDIEEPEEEQETERETLQKPPFLPSSPSKKDGGMKAGCLSAFPEYKSDLFPRIELVPRGVKRYVNAQNQMFRPVPGVKPYPIKSIINTNVLKRMNSNNFKTLKGVVYCNKAPQKAAHQ